MRVDIVAYNEILGKFISSVWKDDLTTEQQVAHQIDDEQIWFIEEPGRDGTNFFERLFLKNFPNTERNHFIRKLADYTGDTLPVKNEFLITMLRHIGVAVPENYPKAKLIRDADVAHCLYNTFLQSLKDELDEPETEATESKFAVGWPNERSLFLNPSGIEKEEQEVFKLANQYFNFIEQEDYQSASELWISENLRIFEDRPIHFGMTQFIEEVEVFKVNVEKRDRIYYGTCFVYYLENAYSFWSDLIDLLGCYTLGSVGDFADLIQDFEKKLSEILPRSKEVYLWHVFNEAFFEELTIKRGLTYDQIAIAFPDTVPQELNRLVKMTFKKENDKWQIMNFRRFHTSFGELDSFLDEKEEFDDPI